jgi:RNA polymerase sigma-70 factor (ECF subfamily)
MQVETPKGSVKWSNSAKGYGPVGRHYGPDIFIQAGDQVEFEIVRGPKAPQAANPISSSELIRACASSNNEIPWTEFIRRFHGVIAGAVLRTARQWGEPSRAQVEDLIQDTYLKLCEDNSRLLASFRPRHEDAIYGFLKVVTANVVRDHFKSALAAKRGASQTEAIVETVQIDKQPGTNHALDVATQRLQLEQIDKVLRQVAAGNDQERKRTIFWLRHRQGFTAREIASIPSLGLTTEGVESVLMRLSHMIKVNGVRK